MMALTKKSLPWATPSEIIVNCYSRPEGAKSKSIGQRPMKSGIAF